MKSISPQVLQEQLQKQEKDILFVDVRTKAEHKGKRIPGVENIPLDDIQKHIDTFKKYKTVYLHCHSGNRSSKACQQLLDLGLTNVINVTGGISEWEESGFPVITKKGHLPIIRQVHIIAGGLALLGSILAILLSPWWALLSGVMGAGLFFAGATGFCGMAKILSYMPWNQ